MNWEYLGDFALASCDNHSQFWADSWELRREKLCNQERQKCAEKSILSFQTFATLKKKNNPSRNFVISDYLGEEEQHHTNQSRFQMLWWLWWTTCYRIWVRNLWSLKHTLSHFLSLSVSRNWTGEKWKVLRRLSTSPEQTERDGAIVKAIEN